MRQRRISSLSIRFIKRNHAHAYQPIPKGIADRLRASGFRVLFCAPSIYSGKLGVVEEGALADLLLVDGDPLENIELVAEPEKSFVVIMKDGKVYKNTVGSDSN